MRIKFLRNEYDPFIDYLKGISIIFVVWTHCIPRDELSNILFPFWGDTAVPLFLLIQTFHCYKKDAAKMPSFKKLWKRIILPYLIFLFFMFAFGYLIYYKDTSGQFDLLLYWDNRGPGSYYIFVYLQFAFLLPLIHPILRHFSLKWLCLIFVIISLLIEYLIFMTQCPDAVYRITFFRYTFLIYLGYFIAKDGIPVNTMTIFISLISMAFIYFFNYTTFDWGHLFCINYPYWRSCHWICYPYVAILYIWLLRFIYNKSNNPTKAGIQLFGKYSYEIYLFQMFYFAIISRYVKLIMPRLGYITNEIVFIAISTMICITPSIVRYYIDRRH